MKKVVALLILPVLFITSCVAIAADAIPAEPLDAIWLVLPEWVKVVGVALSGLMVLGQTIIAMTPSQNDDAWLRRMREKPIVGLLFKGVAAFAPVHKKEILIQEAKAKKQNG